MQVVFATAELAPLARVGGLAAAAAGYVKELRRQGVDVVLVVPDYSGIPLRDEVITPLDLPFWALPASARTGIADGVGRVTLVDVPGIHRTHPYLQPDGSGWPDNDARFFAFSAAVAAIVESERPDVLHLNDWHTATTLAHLAVAPPTVLTIHTLGYQGQTDPGWEHSFAHHRELFRFGGAWNPLVGGIRAADLVVAVSPHYAAEIVHDESGFGLAGVLRDKGDRLVGILNGIDTEEWDPAADANLAVSYDAGDARPKASLRTQLLHEFGLTAGTGPVLTMVTRLAEQKGVDLALPIAPFLRSLDARLLVLGSGEQHLVDALTTAQHDHPQHVAFHNGYDEGIAHRLFGGGDVFVMPSRFEPCGLAQMQAMRYGTLPLVTDVGGLHDTVIDIDTQPSRGTGVVIGPPTAMGVLDGLHRATRAWLQPRRRAAMQRRGMTTDWSWTKPVVRHVEWYRQLITERS